MVQLVLDPRDTAPPARAGDLLIEDAAVRRLGRYPDIGCLQPGDVLLFAPVHATAATNAIVAAQTHDGFTAEDARWTHAAVYARRGTLIEAVMPRVCITPLWHYVPTRLVRVRRVATPRDPATFGYRLALEMATRISEPYEASLLWRIPLYRWLRAARAAEQNPEGRVWCSQIIADSFASLKEGAIYQDGPSLRRFPALSPAHLSNSTLLRDVVVPWLGVQ